MKSYFAIAGRTVRSGGFIKCYQFAERQVQKQPESVVKICVQRAGERHATVIGEFVQAGFQTTRSGRVLKIGAAVALE